MGWFANIITPDGRPECPITGCHKPVDPDTGTAAMGVKPDVLFALFLNGELAQPEGLVIVHKACAAGSDEVAE